MPPGAFNVTLSEPCVTLQGAATWQIECHVVPETPATLQGATTWRIPCRVMP